MTTEELTALWAAATCITEPPSDTTITAWDVAIDLEWPKIRAALLQGESLQAENARLTSEVARLRAAAARWQYAHDEPEGCRHLLQLLMLGKGDDAALDRMVDRIIASAAADPNYSHPRSKP